MSRPWIVIRLPRRDPEILTSPSLFLGSWRVLTVGKWSRLYILDSDQKLKHTLGRVSPSHQMPIMGSSSQWQKQDTVGDLSGKVQAVEQRSRRFRPSESHERLDVYSARAHPGTVWRPGVPAYQMLREFSFGHWRSISLGVPHSGAMPAACHCVPSNKPA